MNLEKNLRDRCHVNKNGEGDSFVGVKADTDDAMIYFPIGYRLPPDDDDLRTDVNNLFNVLAAFMKKDLLLEESKFEAPRTVDFPMHAYLRIIRDYLRTGKYYVETDPRYKTDTRGNASWTRTVREQRPLVQKNGSLVFTQMTVRSVTPNADKKITLIHQYCVYEAFKKMGWLYVPYMPEKPGYQIDNKESIYILEKKLAATHNDNEQDLFSAMLLMIQYLDEQSSEKQYFFGTDFFNRIWEKMIDKAFGINNKEEYFPHPHWYLDYGSQKNNTPLQPDSIMIYNGKTYVLDAKLYRYGFSGVPEHLPSGPDINKQITYGEYIERVKKVPDDQLYNAFILPFNRNNNPFYKMDSDGNVVPDITSDIANFGEATGDWKPDPKKYERIQGIVIDTRFLMYNYVCMPDKKKLELAEAIEKVDSRPQIITPSA